MGLDTAVTLITALVNELTGLTGGCTQQPSVEPGTFPYATAYAQTGEISVESASLVRGVHVIGVDIHQSSSMVPASFTAGKIWPERMVAALVADTTLAAANIHVRWPLTYRAGPLKWTPEQTHYAVHFDIPVKTADAS